MPQGRAAADVAVALQHSLGVLVRRLRQAQPTGALTFSESSALKHLDRDGPATSADLARKEQISPQSMGATLAALETRGLVARSADPADGRRVVVSLTATGAASLHDKRAARAEQLARALADGFTREELDALRAAGPLLERLAQRI